MTAHNFRHAIDNRLSRIPEQKRRTCRIGALITAAVLLTCGIFFALFLSLRTVPMLDVSSDTLTACDDGVLSVLPSYADGALLFAEQDTARLHLTVRNISDIPVSALSLDCTLPDGLVAVDAPSLMTADELYPDASHSFTLTVRRVTPTDRWFALSIVILLLTGLLVFLCLAFFACLPVGGHALLNVLTVLVCCVTLLSSPFAAVVNVSAERQADAVFLLGQDERAVLRCHTTYDVPQRLMPQLTRHDASSVLLFWNTIDSASDYRVYVTAGGKDELLLTTTETSCTFPNPQTDTSSVVRVVAATPAGEVASPSINVICNAQGQLFCDSDGDRLDDDAERSIGTSPLTADTDHDGLTDFEELTVTFTSPFTDDSDRNGTGDAQEDPDGDGLSHSEESAHGTDPFSADSDQDTLSDGDELAADGCDPLIADSDSDGMNDALERLLQSDPTTSDADRTYTARFPSETEGVVLEATDRGNALTAVSLEDMSQKTPFYDQVFVASPIMAVETAATTVGTLTLPIVTPLDGDRTLGVLVYNSAQNDFRLADNVSVSEDGRFVNVPLCAPYIHLGETTDGNGETLQTQRSLYFAVYIDLWSEKLTTPIGPTRDGKAFDVCFVIDGSDYNNASRDKEATDPSRRRIEEAKHFTDELQKGDRAAVISFTLTAQRKIALTETMSDVKKALDRVADNGNGSALYNGLKQAVKELTSSDSGRGRFVIAVADSCDTVTNQKAYDEIVALCKAHHIALYTVGLGNDYDTALLTSLASETGGVFFRAVTADSLGGVFNRIKATAFFGGDTDGDGLSDAVEAFGLRDSIGMSVTTQSDDRFSDEDDLSDGEECGDVIHYTLPDGTELTYYVMKTNPTAADTDNDGIDDTEERVLNTLTWCADTDNDGLNDGYEAAIGYDPLQKNGDGDALDDGEEFATGASFGVLADHLEALYRNAPDEAFVAAVLAAVGCNDPYSFDLPLSQRSTAFLHGALLGGFDTALADVPPSRDSLYYALGTLIGKYFSFKSGAATLCDLAGQLTEGDIEAAVLSIGYTLQEGSRLEEATAALSVLLSRFTEEENRTSSCLLFLLQALERLESVTEQTLLTDDIDLLLADRLEHGTEQLTKDTVACWEEIATAADLSPYKLEEIFDITDRLTLTLSNLSTPLELNRAVRDRLGNVAGGRIDEATDSDRYILTRAFDLECAEYRDSDVLMRALKDTVDRVVAFTDPAHPSLTKTLQLALTDTFVSYNVYSSLQLISDYADLRRVALEIYLYETDDTHEVNDSLYPLSDSINKNAVVFIPDFGDTPLVADNEIVASKVTVFQEGDTLWPTEVSRNSDPSVTLQEALNILRTDADGRSSAPVSPAASQDVLPLLTELQEQFGNDTDILQLAYDWRQSCRTTARELTAYLDRRGYDSVSFVCHGYGGQICAAYLAQSSLNVARTDRVITLGTAWNGTPWAVLALENGFSLANGDVPQSASLDNISRRFAVNLPSVYEQLPLDGTCLINAETQLRYDTEQTVSYLHKAVDGVNTRMLRDAVQYGFSDADGRFIMDSAAIDYVMIVGTNTPTPATLLTDGDGVVSVGHSLSGDGEVPLTAATTYRGTQLNAPLYLLDGVSHDQLIRQTDAIRLVTGLLGNDSGNVYSSECITALPSADTPLPDTAETDSPFAAPYTVMSLDCPGSVSLTDNGNRLVGTISSDALPSDSDHFVRLQQGNRKQVLLPDGYVASFLGSGSGAVDITFIRYDANGQPLYRTVFSDIAVTVASRISVSMRGDRPTVRVDLNSDGGIDTTLTVSDADTLPFVHSTELAYDARPAVLIVGSVLLTVAAVTAMLWVLWQYRRRYGEFPPL